MIFGNWDGDNGGTIYCDCFFTGKYGCERCLDRSFIEIPGPAERAIGESVDDYMRAAMLVVQSMHNNFPRNPAERFEQPAMWIAALDFLGPYANREIDNARDEALKRSQ